MFWFSKEDRKIKREEDAAEEKLLKDLKASLGDEPPMITVLKNRLRIIDLEDDIVHLKKELKKLRLPKKKVK